MFDGIEIDMLSLGDADCIIVTQWTDLGPHRVLIDAGRAGDVNAIKQFLRERGIAELWAVLCTHLHKDHARGLIELVQDRSIAIRSAWMHDIRRHVPAQALRRACAAGSPEADSVSEVLETTEKLTRAFTSRGLTPREPFAEEWISGWPSLVVLGPSPIFYQRTLREFTNVDDPFLPPPPPHFAPLSRIGTGLPFLELSPPAGSVYGSLVPFLTATPNFPNLSGILKNSSVKKMPTTQAFNNTSVILGAIFKGERFLFTADAGADALDRVPSDWRNVAWMQVPHHGSDGNLSQKNIERFCPKVAFASACGDTSHPSRAIVNGLTKVGAAVCSTHSADPGHLWYWNGAVPRRDNYGPAIRLKGNSEPVLPVPSWSGLGRLSSIR